MKLLLDTHAFLWLVDENPKLGSGASSALNDMQNLLYQDNRRFVRIARGSLYETRHWLRRACRRQLLPPNQIESMKAMIDELGPKRNAYLRSIGTSNDKGPMTND